MLYWFSINPWPGLILWINLYISDYYPALVADQMEFLPGAGLSVISWWSNHVPGDRHSAQQADQEGKFDFHANG
jgi:hypothetical protein